MELIVQGSYSRIADELNRTDIARQGEYGVGVGIRDAAAVDRSRTTSVSKSGMGDAQQQSLGH
jgi:hypothetical protein